MAPATKLWTVDEVRALPHEEGVTHELVDGVLYVTPAPSWRHGDIVVALYNRLHAYLTAHPVAYASVGILTIRCPTR